MKNVKVIVKKRFLDRYTGVFHNPGDKLTISEERYREIKRSGDYITVEKEIKETVKPEKVSEIKK